MRPSRLNSFLCSLTAAVTIGSAFLLPATVWAALLGWAAAIALSLLFLTCSRIYLYAYLTGLITNAIGFFWLNHTISFFGGFPPTISALIFILFLSLSSLQHLIAAFIYRNLAPSLSAAGITLAVSWTISELISVRIFPWHYGHTQLAFSAFAQCADIAGSLLITFLMLWCAECFALWYFLKERRRPLLISFFVLLAFLSYGVARFHTYSDPSGPSQSVSIIQGNVSIEEKHNQMLVSANKERYLELSRSVISPGRLIIWPETVITDWISIDVGSTQLDHRLPNMGGKVSMLVGALTSDFKGANYNSALAIWSDGTVSKPYNKQILMPFGEYVPFGETFPWLKDAAHVLGDFSAGSETRVFDYPIMDPSGSHTLYLAPLICYEDIVRNLAREATLHGAELLVNLSNDAWFGESIAPYQHHLLAAFRAIENRRYLIRSTNTGYTAIVDAVGRTVAATPIFKEGIITADIKLLSDRTFYTQYVGDKPWWVLTMFAFAAIGCKKALKV